MDTLILKFPAKDVRRFACMNVSPKVFSDEMFKGEFIDKTTEVFGKDPNYQMVIAKEETNEIAVMFLEKERIFGIVKKALDTHPFKNVSIILVDEDDNPVKESKGIVAPYKFDINYGKRTITVKT